MKKVAILVVALLIVVAGVGGTVWWMAQPRARVPATEVTFETLSPNDAAIRIRGTAHYRGVVHQKVPPSIVPGPTDYWVYALFPVHDTEGREVKILVRSPERPPPGVDFEFVELEGWLDRPRARTLPMQTQRMMSASGYFWDDVLVLTPWKATSFDPAEP